MTTTLVSSLHRPAWQVGDLTQRVPTLHSTDSLSKALRHFGSTGLPALPVVEGDRLLGLVAEADVLAWLSKAQGRLDWAEPGASHEAMALRVMRTELTVALDTDGLTELLPLFGEEGFRLVPVLDAEQRYVGVVNRSTVMAALSHDLRPERVAGLATPLGIYLTTGDLAAGAGFAGLFATGALLGLSNGVLQLGVEAALRQLHWHPPQPLVAVVQVFLFLCVLRLSPLAGYHAAEHMTVHAIERGEALDADTVAAMPREHPRCGTNLMALLFGAQLLLPLWAQDPLWLLPGVAVLYVGWRKVGSSLQRLFTTRRPSRHQLANGLGAGKALLAAYAQRPAYRASRLRRVWNAGVLQVLMGGLAAMALFEFAARALPALRGNL